MALGLADCVVKTLAVSTNRTDTQIPTHAGIRLKLKIARIRSSALLFAKLLHSGADAYIVVSVGSFVTGVVFTLLGIRYRRYKTLHRPFSPDAADKASSQSRSDDQ